MNHGLDNLQRLDDPVNLVGPRGGRLNVPEHNPTGRRAEVTFKENGLHSSKVFTDTARVGLQEEKPWHRMAAHLVAVGISNREIAKSAGVSEVAVATLRAQRFFQEIVGTLVRNQGEAISAAFMSHALGAVERIADLAENSKQDRVRLAANLALVEHATGKPVQKNINVDATPTFADPEMERQRLAAELAEVRRARLGPTGQSPEGTVAGPMVELTPIG